MSFLLDTSIIIDLERGRHKTISKLKEIVHSYYEKPLLPFISYFEFLYGIKEKSPENKERAILFIDGFPIIQTSKTTARILAALKEKYELTLTDLLIAAQTIEVNGVLITKDKDFEKIGELNKIIIEE